MNKRAFINKCPTPILETYRKCKTVRNVLAAKYWGAVIRKNPEKHALHEVKRENQGLLRPLNLRDPKYFIEKMLWLKYNVYNKSSLIALCYNKYEVRTYIESKGLSHILNDLYGVWDDIESIEWECLPDEYVMKISNGYAGHVFKRRDKEFEVEEAKKTLRQTKKKYDYYYYITGDLFVGKTKQYFICERLIKSDLGYLSPEDYKFYCFNGEPRFVEFITNRFGSKDFNYIDVFVDIKLNDRHELNGEADPGTFNAPPCFKEMLEIARILSKDFPFVRVDLYVENGKPIFGELTFTPSHVTTRQSERELGAMLDIESIQTKYPELYKGRKELGL